MREVWLSGNQRAIAVALIVPVLLAAGGGAVWLLTSQWPWHVFAAALVLAGLVCGGSLLVLWRTPRLAYHKGELLVYLRSSLPDRVPIEHVECFFLGQGPSLMTKAHEGRARTIVVRLAEAAEQFRQRPVKASLGQWCEGYITIRGTWCEPIDAPLMKRLNERLVAVKRELAPPAGARA